MTDQQADDVWKAPLKVGSPEKSDLFPNHWQMHIHSDWRSVATVYGESEEECSRRAAALVERVSRQQQERAALRAIQADPHGCRFCDSGKLRNPEKTHDDGCGFALMEAALGAHSD